MVPEVGIAPTSPPLQGGANLPQLLGEMVVPAVTLRVFRLSAGCSAIELQDGNGSSGAFGRHRFEVGIIAGSTPAAGLHAPIDAKPCFASVVCERVGGLWFRQHRKDLSILLGDGLGFGGAGLQPAAPQPLRYAWTMVILAPWLRFEMAEGVGSAPTSVVTDPVFETGAASLYLPAFHKLAARVGLAPTPNGLTGRRATLTLPGNG